MVENYGAINAGKVISGDSGLKRPGEAVAGAEGGDFKNLLMKSITEVNRLQEEADQATTRLVTGQSDNVAEVFTAVKKAEMAFQTLMQIRNKLMDAYDEIKQMRV